MVEMYEADRAALREAEELDLDGDGQIDEMELRCLRSPLYPDFPHTLTPSTPSTPSTPHTLTLTPSHPHFPTPTHHPPHTLTPSNPTPSHSHSLYTLIPHPPPLHSLTPNREFLLEKRKDNSLRKDIVCNPDALMTKYDKEEKG